MPMPRLSTDAFVREMTRHGRMLWVVAAAWVGRQDAEDLVQQTMRVAWERRAAWNPGADAGPWLSQITRNLGANWRRADRRRAARLHDGPAHESAIDSRAPQFAAQEGHALPFDADRFGLDDELARGLEGLSEAARASLLLHVVLGHSFAEVGALLGIPENTAASHARRARLALREFLSVSESQPQTPEECPKTR